MAEAAASTGLPLLRSDVRRRLLAHLAALPETAADGPVRSRGLTAAELADVVGLHVTTVRFHVDRLVAAGLLVSRDEVPAGAGRPRKLYAVPSVTMDPPVDPVARRAYEALVDVVGQLDPASGSVGSPTLEDSGRDWALAHAERLAPVLGEARDRPATTAGAWLSKVGAVLDLLAGWGHTPELRTHSGAREVELVLHDCPFLDLAQHQPHLVCGVHRGLLRGALDALGESGVELDLQPLVTDRTCLARMRVTLPFADRGDAP